jgi:hypothetical protein
MTASVSEKSVNSVNYAGWDIILPELPGAPGAVRIGGTAEYLLTVTQNTQFFLPYYYSALSVGLLLLININ